MSFPMNRWPTVAAVSQLAVQPISCPINPLCPYWESRALAFKNTFLMQKKTANALSYQCVGS